MFQMTTTAQNALGKTVPPPTYAQTRAYHGPERRAAALKQRHALAAFDEVDYGMLMLSGESRVVHANLAARLELEGEHPLQFVDGELRARRPKDLPALQDALQNAAHRGLRKLLTIGDGARRITITVIPLGGGAGQSATLVMLSKQQVCEQLSVQGFARCHGLTAAETRVLVALCDGARPGETAQQLGVKIATVRTQIGNIRLKTGAASIRALVRQVAMLPPLMGVLRGMAVQPMDA